MKIAIDVSPLSSGHSIRGQGFYLSHLKKSLEEYFPTYTYNFFTDKSPHHSQIDVIHYPYFDPFSQPRSLDDPNKTIITVHDVTPLILPKLFPSGLKGKIKWHLQKRYLKKIAYIITDSTASKKDICRLTGISEEKISVVHLAAGDEFNSLKISSDDKITLSKQYNLPEKFALYVGDVTPNKNIVRLAQSCLEENIPLVMVGKALKETEYDHSHPWNKDLVEIQDLARKNSSIKLLGFIPTDDLVQLYNLATVFTFPSLYEGFGLPVLEAMQSGLPVVTTKEGSLGEVSGDAAQYVDPYSIQSIRIGIKKVFTNEVLQKELREKGLKQASKFSWKKTAEQTVAVYEKISH